MTYQRQIGNKSFPLPGETFATGLVKPKTTALFYDRLWFPFDHANYPPQVSKIFVEEGPLSLSEIMDVGYIVNSSRIPLEAILKLSDSRSISPNPELHSYAEYEQTAFFSTVGRNTAIKTITKQYEAYGVAITPVYLDPLEYEEEFPPFVSEVGLEVCLNLIPTIVEEKLTWEQVVALRQDQKARDRLKRLKRWFTKDLAQKGNAEIKAIIEERLDDYQWALRKHGVETTIGGFTSLLSAVAVPLALDQFVPNPLTIGMGGLALASGAMAWVGKKVLERKEIQRDEVAYIYDVKKLVNNSNSLA